MQKVYICDAVRTPIGKFSGALAKVRADDLAAIPLQALMERNPQVDWNDLDDVYLGCANQAGEDNRNVARISTLLAGLPISVPAMTVNRLCGSGMEAIGIGMRSIRCQEQTMVIAGGVEQMSRAPFVMPKAEQPFSRKAEIYDSTMGWRFINKQFAEQYGVDSMPETAEIVAEAFKISRADQDKFALQSQEKTLLAQAKGLFDEEIIPVSVKDKANRYHMFSLDEHPRKSSLEALAGLPTPFRSKGTVTAGNASGINDGACAMLLAAESELESNSLAPLASIVTMATVAIEPRFMGMGPVNAARKALSVAGLTLEQMDVIELNEAFAAQALAVLRELGLSDDDERVNPNGGAIALGHPLGMSGARIVATAAYELQRNKGRYALCTMCIGVGQGIAMIIERAAE